ncbi:hypothetical protein [Micromonospora pisi]|uniref:hypothetical protein n=1 Tax=Micromonospora pisi TaxID=589240 RepID=UPI000EAF1F2B|nr:hypothetical protein [Micromonospora pisi]
MQSELTKYAEQVQALGERPEYRSVYAGVETDISGNRLLVHSRESSTFAAAVRAVVPEQRLWLREVPLSADQLATGVTDISGDIADWKGRGIEIRSVGAQPGLGCVEIGVAQPDRDRETLVAHYQATVPVCVILGSVLIPAAS